jgi:hypothetical protein
MQLHPIMETLIWLAILAVLAGFLWFVVWLMRRTGQA